MLARASWGSTGQRPGPGSPRTLFGRDHFIPSSPHLGTRHVPICHLRPSWGLGWGFFEVGGRSTVVGLGLFFNFKCSFGWLLLGDLRCGRGVDEHLCTYKNLSGLSGSSCLRRPKGQGVVLEAVCIPGGAEGRALRCHKGPWGCAGGVGRRCLTAPHDTSALLQPQDTTHCHPKARASSILGHGPQREGKHLCRCCLPSCKTHRMPA